MTVKIPEALSSKTWFIEKHGPSIEHPLKDYVIQLLVCSDYACLHIVLLKSLLENDPCRALWGREQYFEALDSLSLDLRPPLYFQKVRQFRHTHFLRLMLMELAGYATTEEVMTSWSDCADALILHAVKHSQHTLSLRYGTPRDEDGNNVNLYILAMGKLGGRELNFSSDVDLIFAYGQDGDTDGDESITNAHYFTKVVQMCVQILQQVTADGFVYRVDLRLRPNGDSGQLVLSLAAMENYYQEQGRDWERYAMVKARIISNDVDASIPWFSRLITPFVYRRYVDFGVIESLRGMKAMIEREVLLNPRLDDIKRGKGGIREIEFIIQNSQLIRGGRLKRLQVQNALHALALLKQEGLLSYGDVLKKAYLFYRKLENALQGLNDRQTHSLPVDEVSKAQITWMLDCQSFEMLNERLQQYRRIVSHYFHSVLGEVDAYTDEKRLLANQLSSLWQGHIEDSMAVNLLASLGFENPEQCYQMLHEFRHAPRCRRLSQGARIHLNRFMILLLTELRRFSQTDKLLLQVIYLLERIVGRCTYLALLTENPIVLQELLHVFAHSPWMTDLLVHYPFLLEVLLIQEHHWKPLTQGLLRTLLQEQLMQMKDLEAQEEYLRQFKLTHWFMAARAELYGLSHARRIGVFLSDLAQVIVEQVCHLACHEMAEKNPEIKRVEPSFAIIAYGKLGSKDMNFSSDLDLVFLHMAEPKDEFLVTRLTQKIVHKLTTRSHLGLLYQVDTRLRPSGSSGLLVSHVHAFIEYQKNQAWTWEHQALLKARVIFGGLETRHVFVLLKETIISLPRDIALLKQEIVQMRDKMEQHQVQDPIKHDKGGLLDLDFLIQFLVLCSHEPQLAYDTNTLDFIKHLAVIKKLTLEQSKLLSKAYQYYHDLIHQKIIQPDKLMNKKRYQALLQSTQSVWEYYLF